MTVGGRCCIKNSEPVINFQTTFLLMIQRSSENIGRETFGFYSGLNLNQDKARQRRTGSKLIHYTEAMPRRILLETPPLDLHLPFAQLRRQAVIAQSMGQRDGESVSGIRLRRTRQ